MIFSSFSFI
ncbi:hypothetical protein F8388_010569 [Cannabis sativa]|uniref:Uncharacterized protein n=1 Tax=Cannabis sativa TaxID=3483 RepID=A0A7J6GQ74_CANSA|nr:hypothetical protein F8388_010569 [Cannabis sativa]